MSDYKRLTERKNNNGTEWIILKEFEKYQDFVEWSNLHAMHAFEKALDCLAELEDKIEQGYIKILPVKAGDQIYVVPSKASYGINRMHKTFKENNRVYTQTVDEIRFFKNGVYMVYTCDYQQNHTSELLGETWFLEYEQAANRLKEMEAIYAKYD